jgi:tetratricopeptide (TPR) repeat protein
MDARTAFLEKRDAGALHAALAAQLPAGQAERTMAAWAAGLEPAPAAVQSEGGPVPALRALRAGDLPGARRAAARADLSGTGIALRWVGALLRVQSGDDSGALGRLMAPPGFLWSTDAYALALLGAALPDEARTVLVETARQAVLRAASRGRVPALLQLSEALVAFDPARAAPALVHTLRALRRQAAPVEAGSLLARAFHAGVDPSHPTLAIELALIELRAQRVDAARAYLQRAQRGGHHDEVLAALARLPEMPELVPAAVPTNHRVGEEHGLFLLSRFATLAGRPVSVADVRIALRGLASAPGPARTMAALRALGVTTACLLVDESDLEELLRLKLPVLLYRVLRVGADYEEHPSLLRGVERRTGLLFVEDADLRVLDWLPVTAVRKARVLVAHDALGVRIPRAMLEGAPGREGRLVCQWLDQPPTGIGARIAAASPDQAESPAVHTFAAWALARAQRLGTAGLPPAGPWLEASAALPPTTGFDSFALGQVRLLAKEPEQALAAFDAVVQVEGPSAAAALGRFEALRRLDRLEEAEAALDLAVELAPLDTRVRFLRGSFAESRGQIDAARADLRRALDREPDAAPLAVFLAHLEIGAKRPQRALDVLRDLVRHEPSHESAAQVRMAWRAAEWAWMQTLEDVEALKAFRRSEDPETRRRLAYLLGMRRDEPAEALLRALLNDADAGVRISTLRLYQRGWLRSRVEEDPVLVRQIAHVVARDDAPGARVAAVGLLARIPGSVAARALAGALRGDDADPDPEVRTAAARALGLQEGEGNEAPLVVALEDEEARVRKAAVDALFRLTGSRRGFDPDADPTKRAAAIADWRVWLETHKR